MQSNQAFFYTDTIYGFQHLLADDNLKLIVINSLKYLVDNKLVEVFGYVIMPNHIHLIWNILNNGEKESTSGSFAKFTAHQFQKYLRIHNPNLLQQYSSTKIDRKFQFWKRDPLAIALSNDDILIQKLSYIHHNPIKEKWNLAMFPEEYRFSSASFYRNGVDEFNFLTHFRR